GADPRGPRPHGWSDLCRQVEPGRRWPCHQLLRQDRDRVLIELIGELPQRSSAVAGGRRCLYAPLAWPAVRAVSGPVCGAIVIPCTGWDEAKPAHHPRLALVTRSSTKPRNGPLGLCLITRSSPSTTIGCTRSSLSSDSPLANWTVRDTPGGPAASRP